VTEQLIRDTMSSALSKGGDYADVFFQHRVSNMLSLEDGAVNRASASVGLGVGVRVIKGDQTGYGFTEDMTAEGLKRAALTAASIANAQATKAPASFRVMDAKPNRYPVKVRWEDVRPQQKLTILNGLNEKTFKADPRVKKVSMGFNDQGSVVLIADSTGRIVEDVQPMTTLYLSVVAEQDGRRENNGINRAARADIGYYTPQRLDEMVETVIGKTMILFDAVQPPAGEMPVRCRWSWPPEPRESSCTRPSGTAWRRTSTARTSRSSRTRSARRWRSPSSASWTRGRRRRHAAR
jgi:TldD protein